MSSNPRKKVIYALTVFSLALLAYAYYTREDKPHRISSDQAISGKVRFSGQGMGKKYSITYLDAENRNFRAPVDSIFSHLASHVSSSKPNSELNLLNRQEELQSPSPVLLNALRFAATWYSKTQGALDPTQKPLDRVWSFSSSGARRADSTSIEDILNRIGMNKIQLTDTLIQKHSPEMFIDLAKMEEGWAVEAISGFLEAKDISDYRVQVGKTIFAKGQNDQEELWKASLPYLADTSGNIKTGQIALDHLAASTAGDLNQTYLQDSIRRPSVLDPRTGHPVNHRLLTVTVFAPDPKQAKAQAEAFWIQGKESVLQSDSTESGLWMYMIYQGDHGRLKHYASKDILRYISFSMN